MTTPTLLGISGSLRAEATNRKLIREAARLFGPCNFIEADLNIPLYDGDDEAATGLPDAVQTLCQQIAGADAVVISTPEYNKAPSGVLKNALDWISRSAEKPFIDKPLAVMSTAAGRTGGETAQYVLRAFMVPFRPRILQGPVVNVGHGYEQFDESGQLKNEVNSNALADLMEALRAETER